MLDFDDPRWLTMTAGYRKAYDPRSVLLRLDESQGRDGAAWNELWEELYHQGDVGEVSYAVIPHLVRIIGSSSAVDWNLFGLANIIEIQRHAKSNPDLPTWLANSYVNAWITLRELAVRELAQEKEPWRLRVLFSTIALASHDFRMGSLLTHWESSDVDELAETYLGWSNIYVS